MSVPATHGHIEPGEILTVRIRRSGPGEGPAPHQEFAVPYQKSMRVLDALDHIVATQASDLAYRWLCGARMCGTCAVRMNGREILACWEAVERTMLIEPLRHLPVVRDLVVDRGPYEDRLAALEPWIERASPYPGLPEPLTHRDMALASKALECISCLCCDSACPAVGIGGFAGPAALVQLAQTVLDPRNDPAHVGHSVGRAGILACSACNRCEAVCPAHIPIARVIEPMREIQRKQGQGGAVD